jgi:hypothetical protein
MEKRLSTELLASAIGVVLGRQARVGAPERRAG